MVCLSAKKMEELELFKGDTVMLKGKKGKSTICICLIDDECSDANIKINKVSQRSFQCLARHFNFLF